MQWFPPAVLTWAPHPTTARSVALLPAAPLDTNVTLPLNRNWLFVRANVGEALYTGYLRVLNTLLLLAQVGRNVCCRRYLRLQHKPHRLSLRGARPVTLWLYRGSVLTRNRVCPPWRPESPQDNISSLKLIIIVLLTVEGCVVCFGAIGYVFWLLWKASRARAALFTVFLVVPQGG